MKPSYNFLSKLWRLQTKLLAFFSRIHKSTHKKKIFFFFFFFISKLNIFLSLKLQI